MASFGKPLCALGGRRQCNMSLFVQHTCEELNVSEHTKMYSCEQPCACKHAQVMVSRVTLLLYVLHSKQVMWLYEQPGSSILWSHPRMEQFIRHLDAYRSHTYMGAFGGCSPKPTAVLLLTYPHRLARSSFPVVSLRGATTPIRGAWAWGLVTHGEGEDG